MASRTLLVHGSLVACAAVWGLVFIGIHELIPVMSAVQLVTVRFVIISAAFLLLLTCVPSLRVYPRDQADWIRFLVCGLLAVPGSQLVLVETQHYLSPQLASLVVATSPVLTALFAAALLDERLTVLRTIGSAVALLGVAFIVLFGADGGTGTGHLSFQLPAVIAIITPISWSLYTVLSRPLSQRYPPVATVGLCLTMGTVVLLPFTVETARVLPGLSGGDWAWVLFLALGGSLLPYLIWYWSLQTLPANRVAAYMYGIPLFAMLFAWLILHEAPGEVAWIGAGFVLAGVLLSQMSSRRSAAEAGEPVRALPVRPAEVEL